MIIEEAFLDHFLENLVQLLGDQCEIVVHDFTKGFDSTVVKILNGHISGRELGACPTNLFFEKYKDLDEITEDLPVYFSTDSRGRVFKSSTTYIRDASQRVTGAVCINFEVTELVNCQKALEKIVGHTPGRASDQRTIDQRVANRQESNEVYYKNVNEMLAHYLAAAEEQVGRPASEMNKKEKMEALAFLDQRGVLQISKSSIKLCEFFNISKFTLYSYLDEIREGEKGGGKDS